MGSVIILSDEEEEMKTTPRRNGSQLPQNIPGSQGKGSLILSLALILSAAQLHAQ
jgi:hypothetical protein